MGCGDDAAAEEIEYSSNFAYRYFAGRAEILLALVRDGFIRLRDTMASAGAHRTSTSARRSAAKPPGPTAVCRAAHAYLDFALTDPELYQLMYGLGGVRARTTDTLAEGQAIGDLLTDLLSAAGDTQPERHVLQLWATAYGLIALKVVGRVDVDRSGLHALLDEAISDCLTRALPPAHEAPKLKT